MAISLVEKYQPLLDESLFSGLKSADLFSKEVLWDGANTIKVYKVSDVVIGDYNRSAGYNASTFNSTWEILKLNQDYEATTQLDVMDNEETLDISVPSFITEANKGIQRKMDAYVFSKIGSTANVPNASADLTSTTTLPAIQVAEASLVNGDCDKEGTILYVSTAVYNDLKSTCANRFAMADGGDVNTNFEMFDGMKVVQVPSGRFSTGFESNVSASGGYQFNASTGKAINFIMINPIATLGGVKHKPMKVIEPALNPDADAYKIGLRAYGDVFVQENKVKAIYVHTKA